MPMDLVWINFNGRKIFVTPREDLPGTRPLLDVAWLTANARTIANSIAQTTETVWFGVNVAHFTHDERVDWLVDNIVLNGKLQALRVHVDDPSEQPGSSSSTTSKPKKRSSR